MAAASDDDWDDLRYFLRAARTRSLAGAARALRVEHSTVGRRITALEGRLGAALVSRGAGGLRLTSLGEKVLPVVEAVERAVQSVGALVATERARVKLAVPSGFARVFSTALANLHRLHPDISLELVSGASPVDLAAGEADLAIRARAIVSGDLVTRKLCVTGWSLYASDAYLARHPGPFDPETLAEVAKIGGGTAHRAEDLNTLENIFRTIDELEKTEIVRRKIVETEECFWWFLIPAAVLCFMYLLWKQTAGRTAPAVS